jgi:hypothetical protein
MLEKRKRGDDKNKEPETCGKQKQKAERAADTSLSLSLIQTLSQVGSMN